MRLRQHHILLNLAIGAAAVVTVIPALNPATSATAVTVAQSRKDCYHEHEGRHGVTPVTDNIRMVGDIPMALPSAMRVDVILNVHKCYHYQPNKPTTYDPKSLHIYATKVDGGKFHCNRFLGFGFRGLKVTLLLTDRRPEIDAFGGYIHCVAGNHSLLVAWRFHGPNNLLTLHRSHGDPPQFLVSIQPDIAGLPDNHPLTVQGWITDLESKLT